MNAKFKVVGVQIERVSWGLTTNWIFRTGRDKWVSFGHWSLKRKAWCEVPHYSEAQECFSKDEFEAIVKFIETYEAINS